MARAHLKEVLTILPDLTKEDLYKLQTRIQYLLGNVEPIDNGYDEELQEISVLYNVACEVIKRKTGNHQPAFHVFRQSSYFRKLKNNFKSLDMFIKDNFTGLQKRQRVFIYRIVCNILVDWIISKEFPCNISTLSQNLNRAGELLDRAFPGYMESGLGNQILVAAERMR